MIYSNIKIKISLYAILLFLIPAITLLTCLLIHVFFYELNSIPFIDGKVSVSLIGRQEKTIIIFKTGLFLYAFISSLFYLNIANFFLSKKIKSKFKILGFLANFFLCVYLIALGKQDFYYEASRRISIIFFIFIMYINHIYLIKILNILKIKKKIRIKSTYFKTFLVIVLLMTVLVIIGAPWVNPLFKYPDQLKNIVEWNLLLLTILFYIPIYLLFRNLKN